MTPDELLQLLDSERDQYATSWGTNSAIYAAAGDYDWMASYLQGFSRILEIGVGDGLSTLTLLKAGHHVVGVDANRVCLDRANDRTRADFATNGIYREARTLIEGQWHISYAPINNVGNNHRAQLIEGDILNDEGLWNWLFESGKFDAVACWLIGTNPVDLTRHCGKRASEPDPEEYRLKVQNRLYDRGERLLRKGGVLHFVDRGAIPLNGTRDSYARKIAEMHLEQAEGTVMSVDETTIDLRGRSPVAGGVELTGSDESNPNDLVHISVLAINK